MKCYNLKCKDINDCDKYRSAACLNRVTKEQYDLINKINGGVCEKCSSPILIGRGKYSKKTIKVCTNCGNVKCINNIA